MLNQLIRSVGWKAGLVCFAVALAVPAHGQRSK
jgi:hypothetical protein